MATVLEPCVPPLANGDKLSRAEFLRRWEAHPEIKYAELIGGIVYMASPVSLEHGEMEGELGMWLGMYKAQTSGTRFAHNATTCLGEDVPQPDLHLRILPEFGGHAGVAGRYLDGAPELVAEVCYSSAAHDLHAKLDMYREAQVAEYLALLLYEKEIQWHVLVNAEYQLLAADPAGVWRSQVFPGLWLDGPALLEGNTQAVLARLEEGLRSPEHERFVALLADRKATGFEK